MFRREQISFRVYVNVTIMQKYNYTKAISTKNPTYSIIILISAQFFRHTMAN